MPFWDKSKRQNRRTGLLGEDIACKYLLKHGYIVKFRNYRKPWGEIDIIAVKDGITHFVEVKSVIVREGMELRHTPEENVNAFKLKQIRRMVSTYFLEQNCESAFHFDIASVYIRAEKRVATVKFIADIIL